MSVYSGAWDRSEVRSFLTVQTVPIRLSMITQQKDPWILSMWYLWEEGRIFCATPDESRVVEYLRSRPVCGFEVSTNDKPYRGVRGKGPVSIEPDDERDLLRRLLERYGEDPGGRLGTWLLNRDVHEMKLIITPEKYYSWDYSDRMGKE